jgi:prepilin-type N-terminal cleavage/methylation domain-containing protein
MAGRGTDRHQSLPLQGEPVSPARLKRRRAQAGFTLIELIVATTIGLVIMTALGSVLFTTYQANTIATSRVQASSIIGLFQATAHDDFALSSLPPVPGGCGTVAQPCTQQAIQLAGCRGPAQSYRVVYAWSSSAKQVGRTLNGVSVNAAATGVSAFSWYIDGAAPYQTVVITLTATVGSYNQTQTLRFYPRVVTNLPANVTAPC